MKMTLMFVIFTVGRAKKFRVFLLDHKSQLIKKTARKALLSNFPKGEKQISIDDLNLKGYVGAENRMNIQWDWMSTGN